MYNNRQKLDDSHDSACAVKERQFADRSRWTLDPDLC